MMGPRPVEVVDRLRALEADGALVVQGNTDVAVADFDYAAAFPWMEQVTPANRASAEWAHEQLSDEQLEWLPHLPAERRLWSDGLLTLVCHGSPGSQTTGLRFDLDIRVTRERVTRTDARVICCGHTQLAEVRELGRKLICNRARRARLRRRPGGVLGAGHDPRPAAGNRGGRGRRRR